VVVGGAVGGSIGLLLLLILGFLLWARHKKRSKKPPITTTAHPPMRQRLGSPLQPPAPVNRGSASFPGTSGHEQVRPPGHNPVPQSAGYDHPPPTNPVSSGVSGQMASNAQTSEDPTRGGPPLGQPALPSSIPQASSLAPHRLSAAPLPQWVERARDTPASPSQYTCTIESSSGGPGATSMQSQPRADGALNPRPELQRPQSIHDSRPQSIHDPRYHTAADFYGLSHLPQRAFDRNDS
jgi:hypothetical protein